MNEKEHKERHKKLHQSLDELMADFIEQTGGLPSKTSLMDFIVWSSGQTKNPTENNN